MARFTINPPNEKITTSDGYVTPSWYRFFSRVQGAIGEDAVALIQAAPILTYSATINLSNDKVLTQGTGLSFTSGASTLTIALAASGVTAASYGSASQVASFTVDTFGRLTAAANVTITPAAIGAVPTSRLVIAGAGLTGGGDLSADRTFDVGAGTGITVNANDVALDTANTRNTDHASVTLTAGAGLTGGGDITASRTFDIGAGTGITVNTNDVALDTTSTRNTDHAGVTLTAGAGLTGGGTIEASRTFDVGAGTGITVNANDVALDTSSTRNTDHAAVTMTAGAGLTGGGDITASRSFAVGAGTGITVNADDVALTDMAQATVKGRASGAGAGAPTDLSAAQLVTIVNTADGAGSGLDADLLDGMNTSASGDRWGVIPFVATDGVMEVGQYIDFHNSDADAGDNAVRLDTGGGTTDLYINGGVVARAGGTFTLPSYTVAGLPSAATAAQIIYVSNESGGAVIAFSDGTNWRRVTDRAVVS